MTYIEMEQCRICPRKCGVNRSRDAAGVCGMTEELRVARAALHLWEEPCISGTKGSGTVFFSGCALHCVYCQNQELAAGQAGETVSVERLSQIFLELQEQGAVNINLVTPSHYAPQVLDGVKRAKDKGLILPIVYNCGGYEKPETLKTLEGVVDIYLTDFKYLKEDTARRYSKASDYPRQVKDALQEMVRQQPAPVFAADGRMEKGVIVRHLLLPGHVKEGQQIVKYIHETYGNQVYMSLMNQYTPFDRLAENFPELCRKVTGREYESLIQFALDIGVEQAFIQEGQTAQESFIPAFDGKGVNKRTGRRQGEV